MNRKLTVFANTLEGMSAALLLLSALRADGGLPLWLPMALAGILLGSLGLILSWLCSDQGRAFRRQAFGTAPAPVLPSHTPIVIPFPKAG